MNIKEALLSGLRGRAHALRADLGAYAVNHRPLEIGILSFLGRRVVFASQFFEHGGQSRCLAALFTHSGHKS